MGTGRRLNARAMPEMLFRSDVKPLEQLMSTGAGESGFFEPVNLLQTAAAPLQFARLALQRLRADSKVRGRPERGIVTNRINTDRR
jgi:hypothetical protein